MVLFITSKWNKYFSSYRPQVARLQKSIRRSQHFLASRFQALSPEIEAAKKEGIRFSLCLACGYEAAKVRKLRHMLFERHCLVCGWKSNFLEVSCPDCGKPVIVESDEGGEYRRCERDVDFHDLLEMLGPAEDPKEDSLTALCSACEHCQPTAIPFGDCEYLCLNCLTLHDKAGQCGWCGELITGDTSDTWFSGCFHCPGPDMKD